MKKNDEIKLLKTAAILLTDAMVFQEVLARSGLAPTLASIRRQRNVKRALENVWDKILKVNYQPIFQIARNILSGLPASPNINKALNELTEIAEDIASSHVLLKHDLFGRIYHMLLLGKLVKYYATLYTSIPVARLLARLLVGNIDASSYKPKFEGEPIRVVDFACGSGTLLSAIYKELELKHRLECPNPDVGKLHKYLIEEGIWGFDVLQHATHLAMTTLALHNPIPVNHSRIYCLKLGVEGKNKYLGSIDFLRSSKLPITHVLSGGKTGPIRISETEREVEGVELPDFHICIMNPPFTRSAIGNLLFGALPSKERKILLKELNRLLSNKGLSGIGQAGSAAVFVFIADKYLLKGGRIGLVLPRAMLSGVSWKKVRDLFLNNYHIEYIITSFEGDNNWNFSENTNLSEILLVARKLKEEENTGYTIFVNLWRKPKNEIESILIGSQLLEMHKSPQLFDIANSNASIFSIRVKGKKIGEAYSALLSSDDKELGHYSFFAQAELNRVLVLLRNSILYLPKDGIICHIPLTPLSNVINDIGHDCGSISKTFQMDDAGTYKGFWGQRSDEVLTIAQNPNTNLSPKPNKTNDAKRIWDKRSKLLIAYRAWLPTNRILSIVLSEPVVSSMWWNIITKDEEDAKILALWLNSTLGLLLLLSVSEVTRGPWIEFKKGNRQEKTGLWGLPVINIYKLTSEQKEELVKLYEKTCKKQLKPLPDEFAEPNVREQIDNGINEILGIKVNLSDLYEMLSKDPMITGKKI